VEQDQKNAAFKLKSRSGQAVVEYLLLMVIIVAICIGIGKGFGVLNTFLNKYIGEYVVCLMEYGELPSLGSKAPELTRHLSGTGRKCDDKFSAFTFESGRAAYGSGPGGGRNGSGGNNSNSANDPNGQNGNSNSKNSNAAKKGSDDGSNSGNAGNNGSGGSDGDGSGSKSPYRNGQIARAGSPYGTSDGFDDSQRVKIIALDEEEDTSRKRKNKNYSVMRNDYDRSGYRAVTGRMQEEYQKAIKNKINRAPSTSVTKISATGSGLLPYKKTLPQRSFEKPKEQTTDNSGFSFGSLIRFLLIAGMVVAIVIFFGGQILNYSNSKE
jgi:hypothetical protein